MGWTGSNDLCSGLSDYTSSNPYIANSRDHRIGSEFSVSSGSTYRIFVTGKQTAGSLPLQGGIWYTEYSSGSEYESYEGSFIKLEDIGNGYSKY